MAHQAAIATIEHNVANANTPGYRRQEVKLSAGFPYAPPGMYRPEFPGQYGTGVMVQQVRRHHLEFFDGRYRLELGASKRWEEQHAVLDHMETILAETGDDGLSSKMEAFWSGWQKLSSDPTNTGAREELLSSAQTLVRGFNDRALDLQNLRTDQDQAVRSYAEEINLISEQLAGLNAEIARVTAQGDQPNDHLDQRDRLLDRLAELGGAVSSIQTDGSVLVSVGGHALVVGDHSFQLQITNNPANANLAALTWEDGAAFNPPDGALLGVLNARDNDIPTWQTHLDSLANTLAAQVNGLHQTGYGLNNATGLDFFTGTGALGMRLNTALDAASIASASAADSPADGSLAQQIANLQHSTLMAGNKSFNQFHIDQVSALGTQIKQAQSQYANRSLVVNALEQQKMSVEGVSLDEEAANLVKAQRAYEAASRMVTVVDEMLDRIINGMGVVGR